MHIVGGTGIHVKVGLNRSLLGGVVLRGARTAAAISAAALPADQPVKQGLDDGVIQVEEHSADKDVADSLEPRAIEVRHGAACQTEADNLLREVSIDQHEQDTRVEELHEEGH